MTTSARRRARGQVLVMACLTFLLLALTLMASFSVSHAVHERIRIQAASDAQAFSIATLEARGFNTIAYMNRAIAGGIVAELGLHAWRAIASRDVAMYQAGFFSFLMVAASEFAQCPKFQIQHCIHGIQALRIAFKYNQKHRQAKNDLESKDQKWHDAVKGFSDMIKKIYDDEKSILDKVKGEINGGVLLQRIKFTSAPNASMKNFQKYNLIGLACAVEGSSFDDKCEALGWKRTVPVASASDRTHIMESAAKAARNPMEIGRRGSRSLSASGYRSSAASDDSVLAAILGIPPSLIAAPIDGDISSNPQNMMDVQSEGSFKEISILNEKLDVSDNKISGSEPIAIVVVTWKDGYGGWITSGSVPSSANDYKGVPCDGSGGCFINFRMGKASSGADDDTDYGQPSTYGGMSQDLRLIKGGGKGAWEIEGKGEVQMVGTTSKFKFVPGASAYAVSKGKTYFHQLGNNGWQVAPNMFDPFWRAKLQPFLRKELSAALGQAGDGPGQQVIDASSTSVEGVTK